MMAWRSGEDLESVFTSQCSSSSEVVAFWTQALNWIRLSLALDAGLRNGPSQRATVESGSCANACCVAKLSFTEHSTTIVWQESSVTHAGFQDVLVAAAHRPVGRHGRPKMTVRASLEHRSES